MDIAALEIFRAVVSEGGITRAAERLHRVQSNVTTRIRQLEESVGVPLFIRDRKRLLLTPAGEVLLDYSERILGLVQEARQAVLPQGPRGRLRVGAMESTAASRLPGPAMTGAPRGRQPGPAMTGAPREADRPAARRGRR